jgi:Kef-type K+ transport system membrane component KefB
LTEHQLFLFLVAVSVIIVAARLSGELALRIGIPQVVGELLAGIALGPSLLGKLWPGGFSALFPADPSHRGALEIMGWLGVVFLVLLAGFDTRLGIVRRAGRAVITTWAGGFFLPFALGFALGWFIPARLMGPGVSRPVFALFVATAISISAIPVIARILMELNLFQTRIGMVTISAAVGDDMIGWVLLALVTGLSVDHHADAGSVAVPLVGALLFLLLAFTLGQWGVRKTLALCGRLEIPFAQTTAMLAIVLIGGSITQALHLHLVLGAFVAGILLFRTPWRTRDPEAAASIRAVGMGIFAPFFFGYTGIKVDLTTLTGSTLLVAMATVLIACVGKLVGGGVGARIGGLGRWEAAAVGAGRNARGTSELIIGAIGLSIGVLTLPMYTIIVLVAVVTSLMAGPLVRYCAHRMGLELRRADLGLEPAVQLDGFVAGVPHPMMKEV